MKRLSLTALISIINSTYLQVEGVDADAERIPQKIARCEITWMKKGNFHEHRAKDELLQEKDRSKGN